MADPRTAMVMASYLTPELVRKMRNALGLKGSHTEPWRNFYACDREDADWTMAESIQAAEWVPRDPAWLPEGGFYRVTDLGRAAVRAWMAVEADDG